MISLQKIDERNWREVIEIEVGEAQKSYIESNTYSLLEAAYDRSLNWHPFGVYKDESCIGFAMIGAFDSDEKTIWLDRLMLAKEYQGQGFGLEVLDVIVDFIKLEWEVDEIILSVTAENKKAIRFYEAYGFDWLDKVDPANGEYLMRLKV